MRLVQIVLVLFLFLGLTACVPGEYKHAADLIDIEKKAETDIGVIKEIEKQKREQELKMLDAPQKEEKNFSDKLTNEMKKVINKYLADEGFNKYGDPEGTLYAGGTPLFNEATGVYKDRFEYIFERQPNILEKALSSTEPLEPL